MKKKIKKAIPSRSEAKRFKHTMSDKDAKTMLGHISRSKIESWMRDQGYELDNKPGHDGDTQYLLMDGHDDAFIGMVSQFGKQDRACYDLDKVFENLRREFRADVAKSFDADPEYRHMDADTRNACIDEQCCDMAQEWYDYNIIGAWLGEGTPVFLKKMELK